MRRGVLLCLCYYLPNISGLTLAAREQARFLSSKGYPVQVLTSRAPGQAACETQGEIQINRSYTPGRLGKAPIMPFLARDAWLATKDVSVVVIHLPHPNAAILTLISRLRGRQVLLHYHCSLSRKGLAAQVLRVLTAVPHILAGWLAGKVQVVSEDYARQSVFCRLFWHKLRFAPPPVPADFLEPVEAPATRHAPLRVGFVGRLARQKNLPLLFLAFRQLCQRMTQPVVLELVGPSDHVIGEAGVSSLLSMAEALGCDIRYRGVLPDQSLRHFYRETDLLVLPSSDRQESFGLVQVEAMVQGVPVVALDLPGIREPIRQTGMGLLVATHSATALCQAMLTVLTEGPPQRLPPEEIRRLFAAEVSCAPILQLLASDQSPASADLRNSA